MEDKEETEIQQNPKDEKQNLSLPKKQAVDDIKINKSCNTEDISVEDIKEVAYQDKYKTVYINKVCTRCEEMKEVHGHLLGESKGMEHC